MIVAALVAAACVVVSASYLLYDTDLWSLLVVGKSIWKLHAVPGTDLWTWRHYGEPTVVSSWLFRAILWPIWSAGNVWGLYSWRWAATLTVFALLWGTTRTMGARGFLSLLVMVWVALVYRLRTDIRPETLAALLFALELWILEARRLGGPDRKWWIVPIACLWANVHISYYLGFVLLGAYALDATALRRADRARPLLIVALAALGASFLNPFGWRLLWQPFEFVLFWRHDPMFQTIGELQPVVWEANLRNGLPLMMLGWPALLLWRARKHGVDVAEVVCCAFFSGVALMSQRFVAIYGLAAAPFLARDLEAFAVAKHRRWAPRSAWARTGALAVASVAISFPEWSRTELPLGIGITPSSYPARACDFMAERGIKGRGFNDFHLGGYLAHRFWPDRERLPFMSTQPEYATPDDRRLSIASYTDPGAWRELDRRHRFDYLLLERGQDTGSHLLDFLDRDTSWVMVFTDDAAELFVRRDGPFASLAREHGYRVLPAGIAQREQVVSAAASSPALRAAAISELERAAASSDLNGSAHHLLGILALMEDRFANAHGHLARAIRLKPFLPRVHELLGLIALREERLRDAIREFGLERKFHSDARGIDLRLGQAYAALGESGTARSFYQRELRRDPANAEVRDSLDALSARLRR